MCGSFGRRLGQVSRSGSPGRHYQVPRRKTRRMFQLWAEASGSRPIRHETNPIESLVNLCGGCTSFRSEMLISVRCPSDLQEITTSRRRRRATHRRGRAQLNRVQVHSSPHGISLARKVAFPPDCSWPRLPLPLPSSPLLAWARRRPSEGGFGGQRPPAWPTALWSAEQRRHCKEDPRTPPKVSGETRWAKPPFLGSARRAAKVTLAPRPRLSLGCTMTAP